MRNIRQGTVIFLAFKKINNKDIFQRLEQHAIRVSFSYLLLQGGNPKDYWSFFNIIPSFHTHLQAEIQQQQQGTILFPVSVRRHLAAVDAVLNANYLSFPQGTLQCLRLPTDSTVPADVHLGVGGQRKTLQKGWKFALQHAKPGKRCKIWMSQKLL